MRGRRPAARVDVDPARRRRPPRAQPHVPRLRHVRRRVCPTSRRPRSRPHAVDPSAAIRAPRWPTIPPARPRAGRHVAAMRRPGCAAIRPARPGTRRGRACPGRRAVPMTGPSVMNRSRRRLRAWRRCMAGRRGPAASSGETAWPTPTWRSGESSCPLDEELLELGQRLRAPAHTLERRDLAVVEGEDRLHGQELPREPGRLADPAAADEVLERLHGEEQAARPLEALDERPGSPPSSFPARAAAGSRRRG